MDGGGKKMKLQLEVMVNVYLFLAELIVAQENYRMIIAENVHRESKFATSV